MIRRLLPSPLLTLALIVLWLVLNESVSPGQIILGVVFGVNVVLRQPGRIRLGARVVVSDGCILDGRSDERAESIVVGDDAMLSNDVMLSCKNGSIRLGEHVGVNARTIIQSAEQPVTVEAYPDALVEAMGIDVAQPAGVR